MSLARTETHALHAYQSISYCSTNTNVCINITLSRSTDNGCLRVDTTFWDAQVDRSERSVGRKVRLSASNGDAGGDCSAAQADEELDCEKQVYTLETRVEKLKSLV